MTQISAFFSVPYAFAQLSDCADVNLSLRKLFLDQAAANLNANPRPITQRNRAVFESNFDLFRNPESNIQRLKGFCLTELLAVVCELNSYDHVMRSRLLLYTDSWFHVTRRGGYFAQHNHPMASWSGVYCVDPGDHDADCPSSGTLTFQSPSLLGSMYLDAGNSALKGDFAHGTRSIRLAPGQLVLFPSWVLHDVKPYEGNDARITVAFNAWFGLAE